MDLELRHHVEELHREKSGEALSRAANDALVDFLSAKGLVRDPVVLDAMRAVRRHDFVPGAALRDVYSDRAVTTVPENGDWVASSCSAPSIVGAMADALDLRGARRLLELGTGTGYSSAVMSATNPDLEIETCDILPQVAEDAGKRLGASGFSRVRVSCADGTGEALGRGRFDRIALACGANEIRSEWVDALEDGGLLVIPVGSILFRLRKTGNRLVGEPVIAADFINFRRGSQTGDWVVRGDMSGSLGSGFATHWPGRAAEEPGPEELWNGAFATETEGEEVEVDRLVAAMLVASLVRPEAFFQLATRSRGWGFGFHQPSTGSAVLCRADGEFTARHYHEVTTRLAIDCRGGEEPAGWLAQVLETCAERGWPRLSDLRVVVAGEAVTGADIVNRRGDHIWSFDMAGVPTGIGGRNPVGFP